MGQNLPLPVGPARQSNELESHPNGPEWGPDGVSAVHFFSVHSFLSVRTEESVSFPIAVYHGRATLTGRGGVHAWVPGAAAGRAGERK